VSDAVMLGLDLMTLAQDSPRQTGPDFGKASPFGLIIVVLLLIAVFGLVWSMNKHLRRLPKSFDEDETAAAAPADGGSVAAEPDPTNDNRTDGSERESG